jgi:adenylate cyclase class IV
MVEIEMRAIVNEDFLNRLKKKYQLSEVKTYGPYTDDYYKPKGISSKEFDPNNVTLRTRKLGSDKDMTILLDKISYEAGLKKSAYGKKVVLFTGPEDIAKDILKTLGFEHWFSIKKRGGKEYNIVDKKSNLNFNFYLEDIESIGNTIEVEFKTSGAGANSDKIIYILGIEKKNIINKNMASFVAGKLGLI